VSEPNIQGKKVSTQITCEDVEGKRHSFVLHAKYEEPIAPEYMSLMRLAAVMPVLNYGLFTKEIRLMFPVSRADFSLLNDFISIFSRDIFINKLIRRKNPYILPEFALSESDVSEKNARPMAEIVSEKLTEDQALSWEADENAVGVLSSGGKESLLTYGMLKEVGADVYPLYINESGGHWRTAIPAYRHHAKNEANTARVWLNVDRFYTFMLDHMRIIRKDHRKVWSDTYPIRLCIFPVYVFFLLPIFASKNIGNLLIGSEFDDPRLPMFFKGIRHYFGVYDQTQDFDLRMGKWYEKRIPGLRQWSAVRSISGMIVERILARRYPKLAKVQRSCHSCHFEDNNLVPCGECSKCLGVLLFLRANNVDPSIMDYRKKDVADLPSRLAEGVLRLDEDERGHAAFLASKFEPSLKGTAHAHVETIHLHKATGDLELVPAHFRAALLKIIIEYTNGFSKLEKDTWVPAVQSIKET
jgi:hypothetical protein